MEGAEDQDQYLRKLELLLAEGNSLLTSLPISTHFRSREREIKQQYQANNPAATAGRNLVSYGLGAIFSGGGRRTVQSVTSQVLRSRRTQEKEQALQEIRRQEQAHQAEAERIYGAWLVRVRSLLETDEVALRKLLEISRSTRLETRLKKGVHLLERLKDSSSRKVSSLILSGEPLRGRSLLQEVAGGAILYVKIQEPYPSTELLSFVETLPQSVRCTLLIGVLDNKKKNFERDLELLRKTGRGIVVVQLLNAMGKAPFHDRFLITEKKCVSLGTSFSGLGVRDALIHEVSNKREIEERFDSYVRNDQAGGRYVLTNL